MSLTTVMSGPTADHAPVVHEKPPVTLYPVLPIAAVSMPTAWAPSDDEYCMDENHHGGTLFHCTRRSGHSGRHAQIWWWTARLQSLPRALVRAVWGQKAVPVPTWNCRCGHHVRVRPGTSAGFHNLPCPNCSGVTMVLVDQAVSA